MLRGISHSTSEDDPNLTYRRFITRYSRGRRNSGRNSPETCVVCLENVSVSKGGEDGYWIRDGALTVLACRRRRWSLLRLSDARWDAVLSLLAALSYVA